MLNKIFHFLRSISFNFSFFNIRRMIAIASKEKSIIFRDKGTLGVILFIPLFQLFIYGYAINKDPRHLNTVFVTGDQGPLVRSTMMRILNTSYFKYHSSTNDLEKARVLMRRGEIQFIIRIPPDFSHETIRHKQSQIIVEADGVDPSLYTNALAALSKIEDTLLNSDLKGSLSSLAHDNKGASFSFIKHYNPEGITQYNIAPGLIGIMLNLTLVMLTAVSLIREVEMNTLEMILSTPVKTLEIITGKCLPYIFIGYLQMIFILEASIYFFNVPMHGSLLTLLIITFPFILDNLIIGVFFSTISRTQVQAMQCSGFFFLPSAMLGGFMFPTQGMPEWAQNLGRFFPLNNYLKSTRDILLKGSHLIDLLPEIRNMILIALVFGIISIFNYRKSLD